MGSPRSEAARDAHESSPWMLAPMACLMLLCLAAAVLPAKVVRLLPGILDQVLGRGADQACSVLSRVEAALSTLGVIDAWTVIALAVTVARCRRVDPQAGRRRKARPGAADTSRRRNACNTPGSRSRK